MLPSIRAEVIVKCTVAIIEMSVYAGNTGTERCSITDIPARARQWPCPALVNTRGYREDRAILRDGVAR
jgi:hypothetical protein